MSERFRWYHGLALSQTCAGLIAIAMTFGPRRPGARQGIPEMLFQDPGPWMQVLTWFVLTNLLIGLLALALWLWPRQKV